MLPLINQNIFTILWVVPGVPTSFRKAKKFVKSCYCKAQQISLQFDEFFKWSYNLENNSSNWLGFVLLSIWMMRFDEFFKWTYNLKITCEIDLVLRYSANERYDLTNFLKWNYNLKITCQIDLVLRHLANKQCNLTYFPSKITIWHIFFYLIE